MFINYVPCQQLVIALGSEIWISQTRRRLRVAACKALTAPVAVLRRILVRRPLTPNVLPRLVKIFNVEGRVVITIEGCGGNDGSDALL